MSLLGLRWTPKGPALLHLLPVHRLASVTLPAGRTGVNDGEVPLSFKIA